MCRAELVILLLLAGCVGGQPPNASASHREVSALSTGPLHVALVEVIEAGELELRTAQGVASASAPGVCGLSTWSLWRGGRPYLDAASRPGGGYWAFGSDEIVIAGAGQARVIPLAAPRADIVQTTAGHLPVQTGDRILLAAGVGGEGPSRGASPEAAARGVPMRILETFDATFACNATMADFDGQGIAVPQGPSRYVGTMERDVAALSRAVLLAVSGTGEVACIVRGASGGEQREDGPSCEAAASVPPGRVEFAFEATAGTSVAVAWFLHDAVGPLAMWGADGSARRTS